MSHSYEVVEPGFYDGVYRKPGDPKHGVIHTDKPLKPVPKWLREIKIGKQSAKEKTSEEKQQEEQNKIDLNAINFSQPTGSNDTPEKL